MKQTTTKRILVPVAALYIAILGCSTETSQEEYAAPVTVVSWGGKYQKALFEKWVLPSAQDVTVEVRGRSYGGEYANISTMVESAAVTWDLVQVETFFAAKAAQENQLERIQPEVPEDQIVADVGSALSDFAVPTIGWSYVLAWNKRALRDRISDSTNPPEDWQDFWDADRYPGPRALRDVPQGNIEIALLSTGMTIEDVKQSLYEDQDLSLIDLAFNQLDALRARSEILWWTSGDQVQRELERGSITLLATWNGRVWLAEHQPLSTPDAEVEIGLSYEDAILDYDWWIIPRGARNAERASTLLNAMYDNPDGAIQFARATGYSPPINGWQRLLEGDDELLQAMPTTEDNQAKQLEADPEFWAQHYTSISERWNNWRGR